MTPTPAQIEAAALAIQNHIGADLDHCRGIAEAALERALTAAAEVGERGAITGDPDVDNMTPGAAFSAGRSVGIATTIERCAQVVDDYAVREELEPMFDGLAAAILALKDKS